MPARSLALFLLACSACGGEELHVISWNVESDGALPAVICTQLAELPNASMYALQEVAGRDIGRYGQAIRKARGNSYRLVAGWTGQRDRLVVCFDTSRLRLLELRELFVHDDYELNDWRHRSPLACLFEDKRTSEEFWFLTVHLARNDALLRRSQARGLVAWASKSKLPILATGDFSFDYNFKVGRGNPACDYFFRNQTWKWARPETLVDTNWADANHDGRDDYPDSCLDFACYARTPSHWKISSAVVVRPGDFPDDEASSDHRPVHMKLVVGTPESGSRVPDTVAERTDDPAAFVHWLNTTTGTRHNANCENYQNTKRGRMCAPDEGSPCGICGG